MTTTESRIEFSAEGLRLEGRLAVPGGARRGVVICHPHPRYGGAMDNDVVTAVAKTVAAAGIATLRFNFRGVGASEGTYSGAFGETADARAAVALLRDRAGLSGVALAGYSFGAMIACLEAVRNDDVGALVAIALPATMFDPGCLESSTKPKLFLHGDRDDYCPEDALRALVGRLPGANELRILEGADHFLVGYEDELGEEVVRFVAAGAFSTR